MKFRAIAQCVSLMLFVLVFSACGGGSGGGEVAGDTGASVSLSLAIIEPTSAGELETPDQSVTLAGTARSSSGIVSVEWSNDRGGQGGASGTDAWTIDSIALELGDNEIAVTATDGSGATASRTITVNRETEGTGSVTLSWQAPTERADGTPLTNLAGYYIHYGRMSGVYDYDIKIENPGVTTYVVEGLSPGTWYFVLSSYDTDGVESEYSEEIIVEIM